MADGRSSLAPRGPVGVWHAFRWSLKGLRSAWLVESSFRLEVCLFVLLAPAGWLLGATPVERVLLIGSLLLVLTMELVNSCIEALVDRWGAEFHELAARAKDMGSAAVLLLMLNVCLCWGLIVLPRLLAP